MALLFLHFHEDGFSNLDFRWQGQRELELRRMEPGRIVRGPLFIAWRVPASSSHTAMKHHCLLPPVLSATTVIYEVIVNFNLKCH